MKIRADDKIQKCHKKHLAYAHVYLTTLYLVRDEAMEGADGAWFCRLQLTEIPQQCQVPKLITTLVTPAGNTWGGINKHLQHLQI